MSAPDTQRQWGIDNDYAPLKDVLLGVPEYFQWVEAGPLIGRTLHNAHKTGDRLDLQLAMSQHAKMVRIYEDNGVRCHYLDSDQLNAKMRALGFEVYDPDMSMFTLGGGGVHCLAQAPYRDSVA